MTGFSLLKTAPPSTLYKINDVVKESMKRAGQEKNMPMMRWFRALSPRQQAAAPYLFLAAAVFAVYANVYRNTFINDDLRLIVHNSFLLDWRRLPDLLTNIIEAGAGSEGFFYRPMQMLLYFFLYQLFGASTVAFHVLNVALHAVNAGLVYRLGCRLGLKSGACFAAALLWAVHPLHAEAVTYMASTADPLFGFFCLSGLLVLLPDFTQRKIWTASLLFVLALGSKEAAVVFPALAVTILFLVSKERLRFSTYLRTWPLWLLAAVYMAVELAYRHKAGSIVMYDHMDALYFGSYEHNPLNRVLTALATLPVYFGLIVWPHDLHLERVFAIFTGIGSWQVMAGAAMAVGAALQILHGRGRRGLALSWGFLWFAAAHAPNTGVLVPINALLSDHWMYLPTVGLFLGVAAWLDSLKLKQVMMFVVVLAAIALGTKTYFQNRAWYDRAAYYENIIASGEVSRRAYNNLGKIYWLQGEFDKAIEYQQMAIERYAVWKPQSILPFMHFNLALMYLGTRPEGEGGTVTVEELKRALPLSDRIPEAIAEMEKAHEMDPDFYWTNKFLAVIYDYRKDKKKADFYNNLAEKHENHQ
jgi:tetratricopeptide (TPR) repeat protein